MKLIKTLVLSTLLVFGTITTVTAQDIYYEDNLKDELDHIKLIGVYVPSTDYYEEDSSTIAFVKGFEQGKKIEATKFVFIVNADSNIKAGDCFDYDYEYEYDCTLMVKFDNKNAVPYRFKANAEGDTYRVVGESDVLSFINNARSAKTITTKINDTVFKFNTTGISFKSIDR